MLETVTSLPFNRFLGLELCRDADGILCLPEGGHYLNHLGTVHASAQFALAEASSGEYLLRCLHECEAIVPVVRRVEAKFRRPARGKLKGFVTASPALIETARHEWLHRNRALITIEVEIRDAQNQQVMLASVEWFLGK